MSDKDDLFITIRENPLYSYTNVIEKIQQGKITKIVRRKEYPLGKYRLRKQFSEKHVKLLDEHIEITSSRKILWMKISNEEAREILGAENKPIFGSYLNDLRKYWEKSFMSYGNIPYVWIMEFTYIKKPVQTKLQL
jgi:hypothetical protein